MKHCIHHSPIGLYQIAFFPILIVLLQGCSLTQKAGKLFPDKNPAFEAKNAYTSGTLNNDIERVIILPVYYASETGPDLDLLDTVLASELNKTLLFEVVPVSRQKLKQLYKKEHFSPVGDCLTLYSIPSKIRMEPRQSFSQT